MIWRSFSNLKLLVLLFLLAESAPGQTKLAFERYHSPEEVTALLKDLASRHPQLVVLHEIGSSAGGYPLQVLEVRRTAEGLAKPSERPAILVTANLEGTHLIGTEAALFLLEKLLASGAETEARFKPLLSQKTLYVAPLLNPDGARNYFFSPRNERPANSSPVDDDLDGQVDEDGPDDLNQDGVITQMRAKDPEGEWIIDPAEPRLLRKADSQKGETGVYKLYLEGIDNDQDGEINEDPPGGVELHHNFPHDFEHNSPSAGRWPISQKESQALIDFLLAHPQIALVLNFSTENTLLNLEQAGRAKATGDKVKVPERFAGMLGLDPSQEYDFKEVVDLVKNSAIFGSLEVTEDRVAQFLGAGPAVSMDRQDLPFFETIQKEYRDALKAAKVEYPEKKARGVGKGSFVAYCYYQYGVPVFSNDIWALPESKKAGQEEELNLEKLKGMTREQFLALEEGTRAEFLKQQGPSARFGPAEMRKMVESGQSTPAQLAEMAERMSQGKPAGGGAENPDLDALRWSDSAWGGRGFVPWTPFQHPKLGPVEIGGLVPYLKMLPPPNQIEKPIELATDFYLKLMDRIGGLAIKETKVESAGESLYTATCYFSNPGWFPTSTAQGRKALTSWPITVRVNPSPEQSLFSGLPIVSIPFLGGSGETCKLEWTIRGKRGSILEITAQSPKLGTVSTRVVLQ
jgi:hypothetical protein